MPRDILQSILNRIKLKHQYANEREQQDFLDDFMHDVFDKIKQEIQHILCFGPCNNQIAESLFFKAWDKVGFFSEKKNHTPEVAKALLALRSRQFRYEMNQIQSISPHPVLSRYVHEGFISGTGTCVVFACVAAVVFSRYYADSISIMHMYSDQAHTFLKINTQPAYIFDFWKGFMIRDGDWVSWNENQEFAFRYTEQVAFKPFLDNIPLSVLDSTAQSLEADVMIQARQSQLKLVRQPLPESECSQQTVLPALTVSA